MTSGTGEPYSLLSDDGTWTGIDADMWAEIEERTGWDVEVNRTGIRRNVGRTGIQNVQTLLQTVQAVTDERMEKYNATIPYYGDAQCIIVNNENEDTSDS